ncbi:MAG: hypothetical protein ABIN01_24840 [Ferruginibacter sp.]
MNPTTTTLTSLFDRIPRRHSLENLVEIRGIVNEYEEVLLGIEAVNAWYEKKMIIFFEELDEVKTIIKKSTDNKASKKTKDAFFDEASGIFKDSIQALIEVYADGKREA